MPQKWLQTNLDWGSYSSDGTGNNSSYIYTSDGQIFKNSQINLPNTLDEIKKISDQFSADQLLDILGLYNEYAKNNYKIQESYLIKDIKKCLGLRIYFLIESENKLLNYDRRFYCFIDKKNQKNLILSGLKRNPVNLLFEINDENSNLKLNKELYRNQLESQPLQPSKTYDPFDDNRMGGYIWETYDPFDDNRMGGYIWETYYSNNTNYPDNINKQKKSYNTYTNSSINNQKEWENYKFDNIYNEYANDWTSINYQNSSENTYESSAKKFSELLEEMFKYKKYTTPKNLEIVNIFGMNTQYNICKIFSNIDHYKFYIGQTSNTDSKNDFYISDYAPQIINCYERAIPDVIL